MGGGEPGVDAWSREWMAGLEPGGWRVEARARRLPVDAAAEVLEHEQQELACRGEPRGQTLRAWLWASRGAHCWPANGGDKGKYYGEGQLLPAASERAAGCVSSRCATIT